MLEEAITAAANQVRRSELYAEIQNHIADLRKLARDHPNDYGARRAKEIESSGTTDFETARFKRIQDLQYYRRVYGSQFAYNTLAALTGGDPDQGEKIWHTKHARTSMARIPVND